jgi:hypothetical protein
MDVLFSNLNIFKFKESAESYPKFVDNIFQSDGNILSTYSFIRSNNVANDSENIQLLKNKFKTYTETKLRSISSTSSCLNALNDINNKMLRIRMLFNYMVNRKSQDFYPDFLHIYYELLLQNINVFIIHIFTPLANPLTPPYLLTQAHDAFDILASGLNYFNDQIDSNIKYTDDQKKQLNLSSILFMNKYGSEIIFEFGNVIKIFFKSHKTHKFTDLISDYKLVESLTEYEHKIVNSVKMDFDYKYKFSSLISKLPLGNIFASMDIFTCEPIFYSIIYSQFVNSSVTDLVGLRLYLMKLIGGLESNIIVTKDKYGSEHLFVELARTFKVFSKLLTCLNQFPDIKSVIIQTINSLLGQDDMLINYIVTSITIFVKKINVNNFDTLKELVSHVAKCISMSNKESQFLDLFNQNLQSNLIKSRITEDLFSYLDAVINHFDSNESNHIKIKKFLHEIEINVCYNTEITNIPIKANKNVSIDMKLSNTILINKEVWKCNTPIKIKIPDQILAYFKVYEKFYSIKHNFRTIEWCYENSNIEIDIGSSTITGSVIPISILFVIGLKPGGISQEELVSELGLETIESIKKYFDLLISSEVVITNSVTGSLSIGKNLPPIINLNKLAISKVKVVRVQEACFDVCNSTDCYIVKTLKPLNDKGLCLSELVEQVNSLNKYFKSTDEFIKERIDILIKKNYLVCKDSMYFYDV